MKNFVFTGTSFLMLAVLGFTACSKVPQTEIDQARSAVMAADSAGANIYAYENFVALQDSFNTLLMNVEGQKSKFMKNYSTVKENLNHIALFAGEVKLEAENRKAEVIREIGEMVAETRTMIDSTNQLILQAPKGKEGTSALIAIKGELGAVETAVNEVSSLPENSDYMAALEKVKAVKEKAGSLNAELNGVILKYKANIKNRKG